MTIAHLLGHRDLRMQKQVYLHPSAKDLREKLEEKMNLFPSHKAI